MSLRVNLLRPGERRRPGWMAARTAAFMLAVVCLAAVLLATAQALLAHESARRQLAAAESQWRRIAADAARAEALHAARESLRRQLGELAFFSNVHLRVALRLRLLPEVVPATMQLTELDLGRQPALEADGQPACRHRLVLSGRVAGEKAGETVRDFIAALKEVPPPADFGAVSAGGFKPAALAGDGVAEHIFEVRCEFPPRRYRP
jgi:hypothetical protein